VIFALGRDDRDRRTREFWSNDVTAALTTMKRLEVQKLGCVRSFQA